MKWSQTQLDEFQCCLKRMQDEETKFLELIRYEVSSNFRVGYSVAKGEWGTLWFENGSTIFESEKQEIGGIVGKICDVFGYRASLVANKEYELIYKIKPPRFRTLH